MSTVVIHFTTEDLARTRVAANVGRTTETLFALDLLSRNRGGGALFAEWRRAVLPRLRRQAHSLLLLARTIRPVSDLRPLLPHVGDDDIELETSASRRQQITTAVRDFHRIAVAPYWPRVRLYLESDREIRARTALWGGIDHLLRSLHPKATWRLPVLTIPSSRQDEIRLDGRGLILAPSLFLAGRPCVLIDDGEDTTPVLAYSVPLNVTTATLLWCVTGSPQDRALGPLIGRTRAAVLEALLDSCTTTELGQRLSISAAAASQHVSVLRESRLISSHRNVNTVLHTLTPLGTALLKGANMTGEQPLACAAT